MGQRGGRRKLHDDNRSEPLFISLYFLPLFFYFFRALFPLPPAFFDMSHWKVLLIFSGVIFCLLKVCFALFGLSPAKLIVRTRSLARLVRKLSQLGCEIPDRRIGCQSVSTIFT